MCQNPQSLRVYVHICLEQTKDTLIVWMLSLMNNDQVIDMITEILWFGMEYAVEGWNNADSTISFKT